MLLKSEYSINILIDRRAFSLYILAGLNLSWRLKLALITFSICQKLDMCHSMIEKIKLINNGSGGSDRLFLITRARLLTVM